MRRISTFRLLLLLLTLSFALTTPAAQPSFEHLLDFHSDVTLRDDNSLLVTETITVYCAGKQIKHGIYRDFPTTYKDPFGTRYVVGFQMLSATRDSQPEPFRVQDQFNGKRIYIGNPNVMAPHGRHVYAITYTTNRQLGFFKDHDELFWNVTGNGWLFTIDHASASIHLPDKIPADQVKLSGFTGPQGSLQAKLTSSTVDGVFQFAATQLLVPHNGLSVRLMWPKGYVAEPTSSQKLEYFFHDNRDALLLASGFLVILLYYLIAWSAVGRDPAPGVLMAIYEPPANLSPSAMRYLMRMGFDNKTFAAAILDMAVRGYLTITEQSGTYTLTRRPGATEQLLTQDERQIAWAIFRLGDQIVLKQQNHAVIGVAIAAFRRWLKSAEEKTYFVTNSRFLIPAAILTVLIALAFCLTLGPQQTVPTIFICIMLTAWTIGVSAQMLKVSAAWREAFGRRGESLLSDGKALLMTFSIIPFLLFEAFFLFLLTLVASLPFGLFLVATGILHGVFVHLMKAPTFAGRRLMDQVDGFKLFLGAVDGDRLNRAVPPQQTPQTFEKFLPYALALDVENAWAQKFSGVLAQAGAAPGSNGGAAYTPSFYSGSSWQAFSGPNFASSFGSSLTSAISSASTAPGSGGGGSGGGGGGGGGGGW